MSKYHGYLIVSGSENAIQKCKELIDMAVKSDLAKFSDVEEPNPFTLILNFQKSQEPRLEEIRLMLNEIEDLVVCSFKAEEVLTISNGKVHKVI